jgi:glycosyltransferase involved in cell wall biosynthesis
VSDEVAEAVIARGAAPERVIVTPCTADSIRRAVPRRDLRREWGLGDEVVVGWVGSFRPFHQAEAIVRAVAALQTKQPPVLLMVGDGPTRSQCEALAQRLGLRRALFPGAVPHTEIPEHLQAIDVAVIPGGSGPAFHYSPLKLKEYLAAGRATVAPRVGEMLRMLDNGSDALLYDAGDEEGMAMAIRALVDDPDLRTRVGSRGRETYDRLFTMDRQLDLVGEKLGLLPGSQAPALPPGTLDPRGPGFGPLPPAGNGG